MKILLCLCLLMLSALVTVGQNSEVAKFDSDADVPRISIGDAKKAFDDGKAVFIDSRTLDIYKQERIAGAMIIEGTAEGRFDKLPKGKKIIVYCS